MTEPSAREIIRRFSQECSQCGICTGECELLSSPALNLGQIAEAIHSGEAAAQILHYAERCSLCRLCTRDCPSSLDATQLASAARCELVRLGLLSLDGFELMLVDQQPNAFSEYREAFNVSYDDLKRPHYDVLFFPGCTLGSYAPELTRAAFDWLKSSVEAEGKTLGILDSCCGEPLSSLGLLERKTAWQRQLLEQLRAAGASRCVTVCGNCHVNLQSSLEGMEVVSLYQLLQQSGLRLPGNLSLTVHDSCPDRECGAIGQAIRQMVSGPLTEMRHHGRDTLCCGSGGVMPAIDPELGLARARQRVEEFNETGADCIVTSCMACTRRFQRVAAAGKVRHCLELVFGVEVDYARIARNLEQLYSGE